MPQAASGGFAASSWGIGLGFCRPQIAGRVSTVGGGSGDRRTSCRMDLSVRASQPERALALVWSLLVV